MQSFYHAEVLPHAAGHLGRRNDASSMLRRVLRTHISAPGKSPYVIRCVRVCVCRVFLSVGAMGVWVCVSCVSGGMLL